MARGRAGSMLRGPLRAMLPLMSCCICAAVCDEFSQQHLSHRAAREQLVFAVSGLNTCPRLFTTLVSPWLASETPGISPTQLETRRRRGRQLHCCAAHLPAPTQLPVAPEWQPLQTTPSMRASRRCNSRMVFGRTWSPWVSACASAAVRCLDSGLLPNPMLP